MSEEWMTESIEVSNVKGLHARPCSLVVMTANKFDATLFVKSPKHEAEANSIMDVMMLDAPKGTPLELRATGPQAREVLDAVLELFRTGFGEDD